MVAGYHVVDRYRSIAFIIILVTGLILATTVPGYMIYDKSLDRADIDEVNKLVNEMIDYKADDGDHWQTPQETMYFGTGDCEDYAFLKQHILKTEYDIDSRVLLVLVRGPQPYHAIVESGGVVLDNRLKELQDISAYTVLWELK